MRRSISVFDTPIAIWRRSLWLISSAVVRMLASAAFSSSARNASRSSRSSSKMARLSAKPSRIRWTIDVDLAIEGIVAAHCRRPAETCFGQRVDEQARGMPLLGEERAVQHRRLQHRNLQPREQCLDAVRQILGLEDEIEQHRDQLDRHRLELVGLLAERRILQIAEHVVRALRYPRKLDERSAAEIEACLSRLQPREALAQCRCRHDGRARNVSRGCGRERAGRDVARAASGIDLREIAS